MAITIQSQPNEDYKQPAWNDLNFVVSSTNTAQSGFKIVALVKVNGTTVQTLNLYTYPGTTRSYCNVSKIVQNYITDVYQGVLPSPTIAGSQTLAYVQVTFQEFYSGILQGTAVSSDIIDVWRASFSLGDFVDAKQEQFQMDSAKVTGSGLFYFLTPFSNNVNSSFGATAPPTIPSGANIMKINAGQIAYFRYMCNSVGGITSYIRFGLYNEAKVRTFSTQISLVTTAVNKLYDFAISPSTLDTHNWDNPFTLDSDDKYFAILISSAIAVQTKTYFYEIDWTPCESYESYEVHWLNRYGGFDSWVFDRRSRSQTEVIQNVYKNDPFDISSPTPTTTGRYAKPNFTQLADTYDLNSRNLKPWEYEGLKDLLTSPEIYIKVGTSFYSATVQEKQTYQNYKQSDSIFNMNVKLKIDNNEQRQW